MKLKYKTIDNVIWFLGEFSGFEPDDIEQDDFDVVCEAESGADSSVSVSITDLAKDAETVIKEQAEALMLASQYMSTVVSGSFKFTKHSGEEYDQTKILMAINALIASE